MHAVVYRAGNSVRCLSTSRIHTDAHGVLAAWWHYKDSGKVGWRLGPVPAAAPFTTGPPMPAALLENLGPEEHMEEKAVEIGNALMSVVSVAVHL